MATYLFKNKLTITRQEGDLSDVVFTFQNTFSLVGYTVKFSVYSSQNKVIFAKTSGNGITVVGQQITVVLNPEDTLGNSGIFTWELELTSSSAQITAGQGSFVLVKTFIP